MVVGEFKQYRATSVATIAELLVINIIIMWSDMFRVDFGVRQGSVLSPFLFAVYLDDLANAIERVMHLLSFMRTIYYC